MTKRLGVIAILALAFAGLADSVYLAQSAASGTPLLCNAGLSGCNIVAQSPYARMFGIPTADLGVVFYGVLFIVAALELALSERLARRVLQVLAVVGAVASVFFTFVQMFLIGAFCVYCLASALITLLVLIAASFIEPFAWPKQGPAREAPPPAPAKSLSMPPNL